MVERWQLREREKIDEEAEASRRAGVSEIECILYIVHSTPYIELTVIECYKYNIYNVIDTM